MQLDSVTADLNGSNSPTNDEPFVEEELIQCPQCFVLLTFEQNKNHECPLDIE